MFTKRMKEPEHTEVSVDTKTSRTMKVRIPYSKIMEYAARDAECEIPHNAKGWAHGSGYSNLALLEPERDSFISIEWTEQVEC